MAKSNAMKIVAALAVIVVIAVAAVVLSSGGGASKQTTTVGGSGTGSGTGSSGSGTGSGGSGYTLNCSAYGSYPTCTDAQLMGNLLTFHTVNNGTFSHVSFYLTVPNATINGRSVGGFYMNSTDPAQPGVNWNADQNITVTFQLTQQQVNDLVNATEMRTPGAFGWDYSNSSGGGGAIFATITVKTG